MNQEHLSELEIQEYAFDKSHCEKRITAHMASCDICAARAANYELMFSAISEHPKPSFDFDLSAAVLARLPQTEPPVFSFYFLLSALVALIGVTGYIYRSYLLLLFKDIVPIGIYLIIITAVGVLVFQGIEMYKKYQRQMRALNSDSVPV